MVSIPKHVQEFLPGKMGWVATSTPDGTPNVTPKGTLRLLDDQHVMFADLFSVKTRQNLEKNPKVAVTVIDPASAKGYQLKGTAELILSGPLFEQFATQLKQANPSLPPPKYVVKIAVESVYDQSVGPDAGKQIG
ncbi:MAG: pyridoxamine 5'-phosphate oxidase family protein [Terriglobia bacterium]|jgi:predicted pyridoxine 5'-phosphate oxidase superfamily flavin-nucleotide-binding protein